MTNAKVNCDDLFAAAAAAAAEVQNPAFGGGDRAYYGAARATFVRELEELVTRAMRATVSSAGASTEYSDTASGGDLCKATTCRGQALAVRIVEVPPPPTERGGGTGALFTSIAPRRGSFAGGHRVHACTRACRRFASRHASDGGSDVTRAWIDHGGFARLADDTLVYWCALHRRAHVCVAQCTLVYTKGSTRYCVLSNREISGSVAACYDDGSHEVQFGVTSSTLNFADNDSSASVAADPRTAPPPPPQRARKRARKSVAAAAAPATTPCAVVADDASDAARDDSHPESFAFTDLAHENTFGANIGAILSATYADAYASVDTLLFGGARAHFEGARVAREHTTALRAIESYIIEQTRSAAEPIDLDTCYALVERSRASHRQYPLVVLPPGGIARLRAYYALLVFEFYMNVRVLSRQVMDESERRSAALRAANSGGDALTRYAAMDLDEAKKAFKVAKSVQMHSIHNVAPNVLSLVQSGYGFYEHCVFVRDAILAIIMLESDALRELYMPERTATEVMRDMKQTVAFARDFDLPIHYFTGTQLPPNEVLRARESVVSLFLARRRRRFATHYDVAPTPPATTGAAGAGGK